MLRAWGEAEGVGVYTRNLTRQLLDLDDRNQYHLFYRRRHHLGGFAGRANVREHWVPGLGKAVWDQLSIPLACARHRVDVLLHPKFTAPLLAPAPVVMVVHGADWLVPDQARFYPPFDVWRMRRTLPLYFRKCARVIAVSRTVRDDFRRVLGSLAERTEAVYFGPAPCFRPVDEPAVQEATCRRYGLPERFLLAFSKASADERKNLPGLLTAYRTYHRRTAGRGGEPLPLVLVGKGCRRLCRERRVPQTGWGAGLVFPGYVPQDDLPAVYSRAELLFFPSLLEAFGIPLTEAMACGTPIVTSNVNGLEEIAGDAALLADPTDPEALADALERLLADADLRADLRRRGLERSALFSWRHCGERVLEILQEVGGGSG